MGRWWPEQTDRTTEDTKLHKGNPAGEGLVMRHAFSGWRDGVLRREIPAFFSHFLVAPVLELLEDGGLDDGEADADPLFVADPHEAGFGLKGNVALGQNEAHIQKTGEAQRLGEAVEAHASGAEVYALDTDFLAFGVPHGDGNLDARAEELLLFVADRSEQDGATSLREVDVVLLQLAAKRAAGNAELFGGESALTPSALQSLDDHLLFHAFEIAGGQGGGLTKSRGLSGSGRGHFGKVDFRAGRLHGNPGHEIPQFANVAGPGMRKQRRDGLAREVFAGSFEAQEMFGERYDIFGTLAQRGHP